MAKLTKAERSKAAKKAAATRKRNKAKRSLAAKKGARKRSGGTSKGTKTKSGKRRSAKQIAATKKMIAANKRSGGKRRSGKGSRALATTGRKRAGHGGAIESRVTSLENFRTAQQALNRVVMPAVMHVYKQNGRGVPQISGPASRQLMG